ncbi:MAG: 30S ribosomal protein S24e [Candidatus Pacearchaeota archaeon]
MEILNKEIKENPLLHRDELKLNIRFDKSVPSRKEIKQNLSKIFNVNEELISIRKIETFFGSKEMVVYAFIYKDKEWLNKLEIIKKKNGREEEKKE